jgi:hypothetical protein
VEVIERLGAGSGSVPWGRLWGAGVGAGRDRSVGLCCHGGHRPISPRSSIWPPSTRCLFHPFAMPRFGLQHHPATICCSGYPVDRPASTAMPKGMDRVVHTRASSSGRRARELGFRARPPRAPCRESRDFWDRPGAEVCRSATRAPGFRPIRQLACRYPPARSLGLVCRSL